MFYLQQHLYLLWKRVLLFILCFKLLVSLAAICECPYKGDSVSCDFSLTFQEIHVQIYPFLSESYM